MDPDAIVKMSVTDHRFHCALIEIPARNGASVIK